MSESEKEGEAETASPKAEETPAETTAKEADASSTDDAPPEKTPRLDLEVCQQLKDYHHEGLCWALSL